MTTTTLTELTKALRDVAATVVKDGALDAAGVMLPAFMDQDKAALKDKVRQSLVLLKDGKGYGVITKRGLTLHGSEEAVKIALHADGVRNPSDKDQKWLDDNVIGIWPGCFVFDIARTPAPLVPRCVPKSSVISTHVSM